MTPSKLDDLIAIAVTRIQQSERVTSGRHMSSPYIASILRDLVEQVQAHQHEEENDLTRVEPGATTPGTGSTATDNEVTPAMLKSLQAAVEANRIGASSPSTQEKAMEPMFLELFRAKCLIRELTGLHRARGPMTPLCVDACRAADAFVDRPYPQSAESPSTPEMSEREAWLAAELQRVLELLTACNASSASAPSARAVRPQEVVDRITEYLSVGGFFNPEQMEHQKVRDLLIDCRSELQRIAGRPPEIDALLQQWEVFEACHRDDSERARRRGDMEFAMRSQGISDATVRAIAQLKVVAAALWPSPPQEENR